MTWSQRRDFQGRNVVVRLRIEVTINTALQLILRMYTSLL
jgi:hypothetical protein